MAREVEGAGQGVRSPKVKALLAAQSVRAREYFARAVRALPKQDARRFVPAEIMRGVYWSLLLRIERAEFDVFSSVVRVPRPAQAMIAVGAWWRTR